MTKAKRGKEKPTTDQDVFDWYQAAVMAAVSEFCRQKDMPAVAQSINKAQTHPRFHEMLAVFQRNKEGA